MRLPLLVEAISQSSWVETRQNRIWWTQIMLWNLTTRCLIKILIWGNRSSLTSTSQVFNKSKVKLSTPEEWLWLWEWLLVVSCRLKRKLSESAIALKAFGRDCQLLRTWLMRSEFLRTLQTFGWRSKPSDRTTFDAESPNTVHQADLLFLPHDKATTGSWKVSNYALTVVDVVSRFKAAEPLILKDSSEVSRAFQTIYKRESGVILFLSSMTLLTE